MALYIKDPAVDEMAARLAAVRGQTKTQAVQAALQSALEHEPAAPSLVDVGVEFARPFVRWGSGTTLARGSRRTCSSVPMPIRRKPWRPGTRRRSLPVSPAHAIAAGRPPRLSGDPFDRILAARALTENATILTRRPLVAAYGPVAVW